MKTLRQWLGRIWRALRELIRRDQERGEQECEEDEVNQTITW